MKIGAVRNLFVESPLATALARRERLSNSSAFAPSTRARGVEAATHPG
jgi:hypothetical protein